MGRTVALATVEQAFTTTTHARRSTRKPELLAPAGDRLCLTAAIENGADAVYFGLQRHNARARAANFDGAELPEVMSQLHLRGVKGYVALNTLAFPSELQELESTIRDLAKAGVDAVIVQDLGLTRLIRAVAPGLEIHASTQMSVTSDEGVRLAKDLGCTRVILARELSLKEIAKIGEAAELPVEVFVHGALCVAYSGQCLTSEALGGRSANRGECAQACRLPYQLVCDGATQDLGAVQYLLSPQDLAAYDLIPNLIDLGVASLKIEGRLKTAEYVANITQHYRRAIDAAWERREVSFTGRDVREMELSFSRGFSHGFLDGNDHKVLVRGDYAKKRGVFLGAIVTVTFNGVHVYLKAPVKPGDGLVLDGDAARGRPEQGGRAYEVVALGRSAKVDDEGVSVGLAEIRFGRHDLDLRRVRPGQTVWKTDDPELSRRLRKTFEGGTSTRTVALDLTVTAKTGSPLVIEGITETGLRAVVHSSTPLELAKRSVAAGDFLRHQLGRLGGSPYHLRSLSSTIEGGPMIPKSLLNHCRRELVEALIALAASSPRRDVVEVPVLGPLKSEIDRAIASEPKTTSEPSLHVLCRTTAQIEAATASGVTSIYADFQDIKEYKNAIAAARSSNASIFLATPRIEKPGEANLFKFLHKLNPDGLLVRNAGGIAFCRANAIPFVADFSLNAANELTVELLKNLGATRVTASYDLNIDQLQDLIAVTPKDWVEVVIHQHIPMFHMEFCAFSAHLSNGKPHPECGRPCDHHDVKLRDRAGVEHPLKADVGCRNTLYNGTPQSAVDFLPRLISHGAKHLRIEFINGEPAVVARTIGVYRDVLERKRDTKNLWRELKATGNYGVTRGPLNVL